MRDFTLQQYEWLVENILQLKLPIFGVLAWSRALPSSGFLVRHDVDRKPANALAMALLEARLGVQTTYYFRVVGSAYDPVIIRQIAALGHEIGYHYEDLALASGNFAKAHDLFAEHLQQLRGIAEIQTIAMHGSPLSRFNNLDMWRHGTLAQYGLLTDAFFGIDYTGMPYFTDTGRSWGADAVNLRDKPETASLPPASVKSTRELRSHIENALPKRVALSVHPERWASQTSDWWMQLVKDRAVNCAKRVLRAIR